MLNRAPLSLLYINVLVVATCGLIYELIAGTLASYLLGDSVTQFSLVIGVYLSALGIGAWLSQYVEEKLAKTFIEIELALALVGGFSAPLLFVAFGWIDWFRPLLFGLVVVIGTLVGLELPLLMRILRDHLDFGDLVSRVLTFDYIGALLASLMFPILLVPYFGLVRTSLLFGVLNGLVGLWGTYLLRPLLTQRGLGGLRGRAVLAVAILVVGIIKADTLTKWSEETIMGDPIVYAKQTPFQRIVVTQTPTSFQLYLNGHLQFNSSDEYRYHEALVHPAMSSLTEPNRVLVLGGGDGLAVREILKYRDVESVTLVDLDPQMTKLAQDLEPISNLNRKSLTDSRVTVVNEDAFLWIGTTEQKFDAAIIDFPDPGTYSVGKLYTTRFYRLLAGVLTPNALVGIQCTSPIVAPKAYWCIVSTLEAAGFHVRPYHVSVPSFGVWGFALAGTQDVSSLPHPLVELEEPLRFLDNSAMQNMFQIPLDLRRVETKLNHLNDQILVRYYEQEWNGHG